MLYLILIIAIILLIIEKFIKSQNNENTIENENNITDYSKIYEKNEYLLTSTELKFYKLLKGITDKLELSLFTQVSLYGIVKNKNFKDFNKIKSKSIDYVITEKNCKIKLCIELDDKTHNKQKRIERDEFINKLFNDLDIKLLRIPVESYYNIEKLEQKIKESL